MKVALCFLAGLCLLALSSAIPVPEDNNNPVVLSQKSSDVAIPTTLEEVELGADEGEGDESSLAEREKRTIGTLKRLLNPYRHRHHSYYGHGYNRRHGGFGGLLGALSGGYGHGHRSYGLYGSDYGYGDYGYGGYY